MFFKLIKKNLKSEYSLKSIVQIDAITALGWDVIGDGFTIVLIDSKIFGNKIQEIHIQKIMGYKNILTIITGENPMIGRTLVIKNDLQFLNMPRFINEVSMKTYAFSLLAKLQAFLLKIDIVPIHYCKNKLSFDQKLIVIASSIGGTEALNKIITSLPLDMPPILIVQHMPIGFTKLFAERLNKFSKLKVKEAYDAEYLQKGEVLIAPAGKHMKLVIAENKLTVECFKGTRILGLMPAADILFESVSVAMQRYKLSTSVLGVILTGMGMDGARTLLSMRNNGAKTIGQDKESCVIYGMPKVAFEMGAVEKQLPLDRIAQELIKFSEQ
jgi:two-component system, chemotaxis family, protein-glutamate methylesterase/glutaminase